MKKLSKIIAMISLICVLFSLLPGCAPKVDLKDVERDPTGAIREAITQTINEINAASYNPLKTGAEAVNSGKITANFTNPDGQEIQYTLNQNPAEKEYSTTMLNSATGNSWMWMLNNGTAYLQTGDSNASYYSLDLQKLELSPAIQNIADLLNISNDKVLKKIQGNYPAFLDAYKNNQATNTLNADIVNTIMLYVEDCSVSVEKNQVVKNGESIDVAQVSYTIPSDKMQKMVSALKIVKSNHNKMYDDYVDNIFRHILCSAGCDFYAEPEEEDKAKRRWDITINELELYLLYSDQDFNISFSISQETGNLVNLSLYSADKLDDEDVVVQANLELAEKYEKGGDWSFSLQVTGKKRQYYDSNIVVYGKIANGTNSFSNSVVFEYNSQHEVVKNNWTTEYNKQNNSFSVYTFRNNEELLITGIVTVMGEEMRMTIQNVQYKEKQYDISITISANNVTGKSNAPTATNIETLPENSLKKIQENIIKYFPESVFGSWKSEEDINLDIFKTYLKDYDYDGDGDCGDDDDLITFSIYHNMLYRDENAN